MTSVPDAGIAPQVPGVVPRVRPGSGVGSAARQVMATIRVEVLMQWRRWGLWATFGCITALLVLLTVQTVVYFKNLPADSLYAVQHYTPEDLENLIVYSTTVYGTVLFGIVAALLVVDRLERDRRLGMLELQRATPQGHLGYTLGKFLGNYLAVTLPALGGLVVCALVALVLGWPATLLAKFVMAFLLVTVPCSLAAVALSLLLSSFLPVRIVQVGFPVLWFEFYLGLGWHGLAASVFNVGGFYVYPVFFPTPPTLSVMPIVVSMQMALLNIAALVLTAVAAFVLTYASLVVRQDRAQTT